MITAPLPPPGMNATDTLVFAAVAVTAVGVSGAPAGVTPLDHAETAPDPATLIATTRNEYAVPLASPMNVHDVDPPVSTTALHIGGTAVVGDEVTA